MYAVDVYVCGCSVYMLSIRIDPLARVRACVPACMLGEGVEVDTFLAFFVVWGFRVEVDNFLPFFGLWGFRIGRCTLIKGIPAATDSVVQEAG